MSTTLSFAPLAARLSAQAVELRLVDGSRDNLAKFMAQVVCALLDILIYVCEMLDARAAVDASLVSGQQANRASLDVSGKLLSCGGLALAFTTSRVRVRLVVDNRAKPGHDGAATLGIPGIHAIALGGPVSFDTVPVRSVSALHVAARSRKAAFRLAPTHA